MSQSSRPAPEIDPSAVTPVVLCGGSGTRLWPLSTPEAPKPFLPLVGGTSLFQQTLARCRDAGFAPPIIVTGSAHLGLAQAQAQEFEIAEIIVEPQAKQTAAAIALAAGRLPSSAIMLVCPSDHHIADGSAFADAIHQGARLAADGMLVCVTVTATGPETGFGYVCRGEALERGGHRVAKFIEKPDPDTAAQLIREGATWNAGIFLFTAGTFLEELRLHRRRIADAAERAVREGAEEEGGRFYPAAAPFAEVEAESVDYAVMENSGRTGMVEADMGWSDIGNWRALHEARPKDEAGNSVHGEARLVDCRNVAIHSDGPRVHCLGVEGLVVAVVGDDVLVTRLDAAQNIGKFSA